MDKWSNNYFWERLKDQAWTHYFSYEEARAIYEALQARRGDHIETTDLYHELGNLLNIQEGEE